MQILRSKTAPRYVRKEGICSYLLASPITCDANYLTTTIVEIRPGGKQRIHNHLPEQVYYILAGSGQMIVADATTRVEVGDCIFIPSNASHGLVNDSTTTLRYFSAAAPAFDKEQLRQLWPIESETKTETKSKNSDI